MINQVDRFISKIKSSVTLKNKRLSLPDQISKLLLVWLIQNSQKKVWNQFSMKWLTKNCLRTTCSHSIWHQSKQKIKDLNLTWLLVTTIKKNSREICTGTQFNTNICMVLNLMILRSMASQLKSVKIDQLVKTALLPSILVLPSCLYQHLLLRSLLNKVFQLPTM